MDLFSFSHSIYGERDRDVFRTMISKSGISPGTWVYEIDGDPVGAIKYTDLYFENEIFGMNSRGIDYLLWKDEGGHNVKEALVKRVIKKSDNAQVKFISARVKDEELELQEILKKNEFKEICDYITFYISLERIPTNSNTPDVRVANESDIERLREIVVKDAFVHSRFYVDKNFNRSRVREFYSRWIENSLRRGNHTVFVYDEGNGALGFIDLNEENLDRESIMNLDLIAIKRSAKGKGIGSKLLLKSFNYSKEKNIKNFYVETEAENINSIKFYNKFGEIASKTKVFHRWKK